MSDGHSAAQDFQIRKKRESQVCGCGAHKVTRLPTAPGQALSLRLQWAQPCGRGLNREKVASRIWG